jgi:hypothetical protein
MLYYAKCRQAKCHSTLRDYVIMLNTVMLNAIML